MAKVGRFDGSNIKGGFFLIDICYQPDVIAAGCDPDFKRFVNLSTNLGFTSEKPTHAKDLTSFFDIYPRPIIAIVINPVYGSGCW